LANLEAIHQLRRHEPDWAEIQQHLYTAKAYLTDAKNGSNSAETRFNIAYSAGHQLLVAALKIRGWRTTSERGHRFILYELVDDLVPGAASAKEPLGRAHRLRNKSEYDGDTVDITQGLLGDLIAAVDSVQQELQHMARQFENTHQRPAPLPALATQAPVHPPARSPKKPRGAP